jgi:hypothetical protein
MGERGTEHGLPVAGLSERRSVSPPHAAIIAARRTSLPSPHVAVAQAAWEAEKAAWGAELEAATAVGAGTTLERDEARAAFANARAAAEVLPLKYPSCRYPATATHRPLLP